MLNYSVTPIQVVFLVLICIFVLCNIVLHDDIKEYIENKIYDKLKIENYYNSINDNIVDIESYCINLIIREMYDKIQSEDLEKLDIKTIKIKSNIYKDSKIHLEFNTSPKEIYIVNSIGDISYTINQFTRKIINFCFEYDLNKEELYDLCLYIGYLNYYEDFYFYYMKRGRYNIK